MGMRLVRAALRITKALPLPLALWALARARAPLPPAHAGGASARDTIGGVDTGWIARENAGNGLVVLVHGGGYVAGPFPAHWDWLAAICRDAGMAGVLIDYRKVPYPGPIEDVLAVIGELGTRGLLRPGNWVLAGDSAGGALALAACRRLIDRAGVLPACLLLASPYVDMRLENPAIAKLERRDPALSLAFLRHCNNAYAAGADLGNPELSPVEMALDGLPPVMIASAETELLAPDIRTFAERLRAAGVPYDHLEDPDGVHAYPMMTGTQPGRHALGRQAGFAIAQLATGSRGLEPLTA